MAESAFNIPFEDDEAIKALRKLVAGLEGSLSPEKMQEFRNVLTNAFEEEFNAGYREGAKDGAANATVSDEGQYLKGEAKGIMWAYYAASGENAGIMDNPHANPNIVAGLRAMGTKNQ